MSKPESNFYKKLTLANLLNWIAIRWLRLNKRISGKLLSYAITLDPNRKIFRDNLAALKLNPEIFVKYKKINLPFYPVLKGGELLSKKLKYFDKDKLFALSKPTVINTDYYIDPAFECEVKLPNTGIVELDEATIFSNTDLVIVDQVILYDGVYSEEVNKYAIKSPLVIRVHQKQLDIKIPKEKAEIKCGIHLAKDYAQNYFHWLIENLPRLSLVEDTIDHCIPLLISDNLPLQAFDVLEVLNEGKREIIKLKVDKSYKVGKLYYPTLLSEVHDNYKAPNYDKDVAYSPKSLKFIRDNIFKKLNITSPNKGSRKIFISRKNSDYRQLLNTNEIEELLIRRGFEIVFPENLSFISQVELFSNAEVIMGQSGAGMANFIFAPMSCHIIVFMSNVPETNLHIFGALSQALGFNSKFLIGESVNVRRKQSIHDDFYIDIKLLNNYLDTII